MLHLALYEPEIPQNTGALIRLSANADFCLHLIEPFSFDLSEKSVRRAGLDYHELAQVFTHKNLAECFSKNKFNNIYYLTTKASKNYTEALFKDQDVCVFGPETRGLPNDILDELDDFYKLKIPMLAGSRSLNLANAASIVMYEAWRQLDFKAL